ncbi:MAG: ribonuclease HII [Anaerolineales bacterium]|nr:ribonuclease HII [Anaerolineales bacterium]
MTVERSPAIPPAPDLSFEQPLWDAGLSLIAGIDEAGRGALAGPVAVAAVILPPDPCVASFLFDVRDSKQMTPAQRQSARERIQAHALAWQVGFASSHEIDTFGILPATRLAACRAVAALQSQPEHLLLDYIFLPDLPMPQTSLIKGDRRSLSIAAASVLAKTARDALMIELDSQYPGYGLAIHKGYGTSVHRHALANLGPSAIHRLSFKLKKALPYLQ